MSDLKRGYKQTEVGVIPDSTLGRNLRAPIRNGYSPVCPATPTGTWILSLSAVTENGFNEEGVKPAPIGDTKVLDNLLLAGDIVVSRSNTPERVGLAGIYRGKPESCAYPDLMMRVRTSPSLKPEFLLVHLLSHRGRKFFAESARGSSSSMVKIDRAILESFSFPLPAVPEQEAIAGVLGDVDALIGAIDRLIAKKCDLKQAAMQQLLTGQTRLPGFSRKWGKERLERLSTFITKGSTPTTYGFDWVKDGILFLRSECVAEQGLDLTQSMCISPEAHSVLLRSEIHDGDILITITGNVGRVVYFEAPDRIANINQHIARIRLISDKADARYVFHYLAQPVIRRYYGSITTGQAYPQISLEQVRATEISLPQREEQAAIAAVLSDMDSELSALEERRNKTRLLKQGMMQELLTGRIRLS
jgi:type I restriction enzyme S subunit